MTVALCGIEADGGSENVIDGEVEVDDGCFRWTEGWSVRVAAKVAPNRGTGTREEQWTSVEEILARAAARKTSPVYASQ